MQKPDPIGGQAVMDGVMMRSRNGYAVAVRRSDSEIVTCSFPVRSLLSRGTFYNLPLVRGIVVIYEMLKIGLSSLFYSYSQKLETRTSDLKGKEKQFFILAALFAFVLAFVLFFYIPLLLTNLLGFTRGSLGFNLIDGVIKILIFLMYLFLWNLLSDTKRLVRYHGAEHKTVHCYEHNLPLSVENCRKFSRFHPRCGTTVILAIAVLGILCFSLADYVGSRFFSIVTTTGLRVVYRIVLLPLIVSVGYEFFRLFQSAKPFFPVSFLLQRLTTKEPSDSEIEVAIQSLKSVLESRG